MEAIGQFPGQSGAYDKWTRTSPIYMDSRQHRQEEPQWRLQNSEREAESHEPHSTMTGRDSVDYTTSPPLASYSALLKNGSELELRPSFGSPPKDCSNLYQTELVSSGKPNAATTYQQELQVAMELANFSLDQYNKTPSDIPNVTSDKPAPQLGINIRPAVTPKQPELQCQTVWSSDDDMIASSDEPKLKRGCSTIGATPYDDDRGFRKKSREKMRRHEVNGKFELLVDLLGIPNRARKKVILHEAVTTIKNLRRECNELSRDRERLQYEQTSNLLLKTCSRIKMSSEEGEIVTSIRNEAIERIHVSSVKIYDRNGDPSIDIEVLN